MDDQQRYERAKQRVDALKGFYSHLAVFVIVNAFLAILSLSQGQWWFLWVLFGWGIGIVAQGYNVFVRDGFFGSDWEQRKIQEYMQRDKQP